MFSSRTRAVLLGLLLSMSLGALAAGPVFHVDSTADVPDFAIDGVCNSTGDNLHAVCTLRAAVMEANAYAGAEEVTIEIGAATFKLLIPVGAPDGVTNGDLNLTGKVRIVGKGMDASILDGNGIDRVIHVAAGGAVTLVDLRVQGGATNYQLIGHPGGESGGGIHSDGALTLVRCLVRANNVKFNGGGIATGAGSLSLVDSMVRVNSAYSSVAGTGGGIWADATAVVLRGSSVYSNLANEGGGLYQSGGSLHVSNCTVAANTGTTTGGGMSLYGVSGAALNNVTLATNATGASTASGGGAQLATSTLVLSNSVVFNTNAVAGDDIHCSSSSVSSNGFNIIVTVPPCGAIGSYSTANPALLALAINGGVTVTHALQAGSPAAEAGDPAGCTDAFAAPLLVDQRGVKRPIASKCDLGAFEREPIGDANGDGAVDVSDVFYLINYLFAGGAVPLGRANVNGDGVVNVSDVFYLLNYLFAGGGAPA